MAKPTVFISHASDDKSFALALAQALRRAALDPWIDKERIVVGASILEELGVGLAAMDVFILLISRKALNSGWVKREIEIATYREISDKRVLILPFILDRTPIASLSPFLITHNIAKISPDSAGVAEILDSVRACLQRRETAGPRRGKRGRFRADPEVEKLIEDQQIGDWTRAEQHALHVLARSGSEGANVLFASLLKYRDVGDQETLMKALTIAESCVSLAPWLLSRFDLVQMARHSDFSVRSSAASMCMELARIAPHQVPVDLLLPLSRYDEDWYVQAPANAALKTLVRLMPALLQVFLGRLGSERTAEREHAAGQLLDIAQKEPELLDRSILKEHLNALASIKDRKSGAIMGRAIAAVGKVRRKPKYRYGL